MQTSTAAQDPPIETRKGFLTIPQFAAEIGISTRTAWRAARDGKVKTVRFGGSVRVSRKEAERVFAHGF